MQNYFAIMNDLSKNWENGLDIYIYYNDSENVNKVCQTGGSLMKRMICNACGDEIYEENRDPKPVEEVIEAG